MTLSAQSAIIATLTRENAELRAENGRLKSRAALEPDYQAIEADRVRRFLIALNKPVHASPRGGRS